MKEIYVIDNSMDDREFRNYVHSLLPGLGYEKLKIEDVRISDGDKSTNNDMLATKDGFSYTIQTYLNQEITERQIKECFKDMEKENVSRGLIVTNSKVTDRIKAEAKKNNIEIIDREFFVNFSI